MATILAVVGSGKTLNEACAEAGIDPSTLRRWRRRAWNPDPAAAACVELEQALVRVRIAVAEVSPPPAEVEQTPSYLADLGGRDWREVPLIDLLVPFSLGLDPVESRSKEAM
jgi:transposase-like protein